VARSKQSLRPDIDEVRTRFEQWRQTRQGRAHIPDELWSAAIEVARRDGVNRTAAALRLDGGKLMKRMLAAGAIPKRPTPPAFVELAAPTGIRSGAGGPEYTIELEGRNGTLRILCKGATPAHLAELSRNLWSSLS
jgi:hypothetical protein